MRRPNVDGDDEADADADAVAAQPAVTEVVGAAVLVELAASLIVSWWLNGCSSSTIATTATAATADRTDQNSGARDRRAPSPGPRGGRGGPGQPRRAVLESARTADGAAAGSPGTAPAAADRWAAGTAEAADSRAADWPGARRGSRFGGAVPIAPLVPRRGVRPGQWRRARQADLGKTRPALFGLGFGAFGLGFGAGLGSGRLGRRSLVDDALPALGTEPRTRPQPGPASAAPAAQLCHCTTARPFNSA